MKKTIAIILSMMLVFAITLPAAAITKTVKPKKPVTLTFATFNNWGTTQSPVTVSINLYEQSTGNKIKKQLYPDDQYMNIIKTKFATGDVPDFIATYVSRNGNVPLKLLESLNGSPWISKLKPGMDAYATRENDKKWVIAPVGSSAYLGAIYNKKVFAKAGIKLPLKNYKELVAACEALQKIGVPAIQPANKDNAGFIWNLIGDHYIYVKDPSISKNIMANKLNPANSPAIVAGYQRFADLKKYFKSDYASATGMDGLKQVATGEVGMFANGSWCYGILSKDYADKMQDIGIMPISLGDNYEAATRTTPGSGFAIPIASKHKNEAKEFINFVMTPIVVRAVSEVVPGSYALNINTNKSSWDKEMEDYITKYKLPTKDQASTEYFPNFDTGPGYALATQAIILDKPIKEALDSIWYKQMSDVNKSKRTKGW
jgi:raffinose/stachyose/melibiose transport system substrate-binding protein